MFRTALVQSTGAARRTQSPALILQHIRIQGARKSSASRHYTTKATHKELIKERVIFEALPGKAIRMLKFLSITGSVVACTTTTSIAVSQAAGMLADYDLSIISLALASSISIASTMAVTRMFGPFVTRATLLPSAAKKGIQIDKHGLPKFDSILSTASKSAKSTASKASSSNSINGETRIALQTPGLWGFTSNTTVVRVADLEPSGQRMRTWSIKQSVVDERHKSNVRTPHKTFTIMWKSAANTSEKQIMQEIDALITL